jgi:DNA repair exonuclease SbcCD ATPase subunit
MARPLPVSDPHRGGPNGSAARRPGSAPLVDTAAENAAHAPRSEPVLSADERQELEHLRAENAQLRGLCIELEQALQEASGGADGASWEERVKEYEGLLEEKSETIRALHQKVQELQEALEAAAARPAPADDPPAEGRPPRPAGGPAPREEELLALSEELERERRQLHEDEEALMEQMREMEVSMARERAEMARQRNELQRLHSDIRHELERLERTGALQSKIANLKVRLQKSAVRGEAPAERAHPKRPAPAAPPADDPPPRREGFLGRLFGG